MKPSESSAEEDLARIRSEIPAWCC